MKTIVKKAPQEIVKLYIYLYNPDQNNWRRAYVKKYVQSHFD